MNLRLRELRESQNISVATMIERLGVKDSRYRKWESQTAAMPLEYAVRCCSILHCTMDELSGREQIALSDDERHLLDLFRACNQAGREYIIQLAETTAGMFPRE